MLDLVLATCLLMGGGGSCVSWEFKDGTTHVTGSTHDVDYGCESYNFEGVTLEMCNPREHHLGEA